MWSLAKSAKSLEAFSTSGHFAVHILASDQDNLSNQFARSGDDKFESIDWKKGVLGSPLIEGYAAQFQCKTTYQYEGGDHIIFVGEVVAFEEYEKSPLVFHGGAYAEAKPKIKTDKPPVDLLTGQFTDDFFSYLLARANFQASYPTRRKLGEFGLSQTEYLAISLLSINGKIVIHDLCHQLMHTGYEVNDDTIRGLHAKGFVLYAPHTEDVTVTLTEHGRGVFIKLLTSTKAVEEQILSHFTDGEIADIKHLLKRIISVTRTEIPEISN